MCGIAGYSLIQGSLDLSSASEALYHRGPDGRGLFEDPGIGVGLAHTRLSILDLHKTGAQPMQSNNKNTVLSYNGEIYNFPILKTELEAEGHCFRGTSDTEVLLTLLETQGLAVLPRLNGIFAFAVYQRATGEIHVVRDAYGVKPLYYTKTEQGVLFASEIRGLTAMGITQQAPTPATMGRYLSFLWNSDNDTLAANIRTLPPGAAMTLKAGKIVRQWQWFTSPTLNPKPQATSKRDAIAATTRYMRAAVHRQMVADVPVGAFLSGGLDSSAVVTFAREISPDIRCYTIAATGAAEEGATDDLPYAQRVAKHLKVPLEVISIDSSTMAQDLELMVNQLEEPLADPACLNVLYIARQARKQGIKVLLSGAGGDDIFSGYRRHRAVAFDRYLQRLPTPIRHRLAGLESHLNHNQPVQRRLAKYLRGFTLNQDERLIQYFLWTQRHDVLSLLSSDARATVQDTDFTEPMVTYLQQMNENTEDIDRILALEQRFFLAKHNLLYTDKMSMATSVEVRVPFLDLDLVAFAATIPHTMKQRGKQGKWILKKAMEPYLPHDVIYRPKAGFGAPLRHWLRGELRDFMEELLSAASLQHRNLFDAATVQRLIQDNAAGRIDASYTLLSLMCIELWCRNNLSSTSI